MDNDSNPFALFGVLVIVNAFWKTGPFVHSWIREFVKKDRRFQIGFQLLQIWIGLGMIGISVALFVGIDRIVLFIGRWISN